MMGLNFKNGYRAERHGSWLDLRDIYIKYKIINYQYNCLNFILNSILRCTINNIQNIAIIMEYIYLSLSNQYPID